MRQARYAIEAGVDVVQLREPDLPASELFTLARDLVALTRNSRTRLLVNDRLDVALAAGADGVHLKSASIPAARVRSAVPRGFLVGRSVHSVEEALVAADAVDSLIAGTVWESQSKPSGWSIAGRLELARMTASVQVPVLAIGGVTPARVPEIAAAGAAGAAAIGMFMAEGDGVALDGISGCRASDLRDVVQSIRLLFDTSRSAS